MCQSESRDKPSSLLGCIRFKTNKLFFWAVRIFTQPTPSGSSAALPLPERNISIYVLVTDYGLDGIAVFHSSRSGEMKGNPSHFRYIFKENTFYELKVVSDCN